MIGQIHFGDCRDSLRAMAAAGMKVQTCVTSPPYFGQRTYGGGDAEIGTEETPDQFIARLVEVFRCVREVLADDGTLWVNIGDSYARRPQNTSDANKHAGFHKGNGNESARDRRKIPPRMKPKDIMGIPWELAFALRNDGWYLRCPIIWKKPFFTVTSQKDRPTVDYEYIFMLSKSYSYFYDHEAVMEPSVEGGLRTRRAIWEVAPTKGFKGAHFAVFPPALIEPCILAGSRPSDIVLDPFMGSGTTAAVAIEHGRQFIGCELNVDYKPLQDARIAEARAKVHMPIAIKKPRQRRAESESQASLFGSAA